METIQDYEQKIRKTEGTLVNDLKASRRKIIFDFQNHLFFQKEISFPDTINMLGMIGTYFDSLHYPHQAGKTWKIENLVRDYYVNNVLE